MPEVIALYYSRSMSLICGTIKRANTIATIETMITSNTIVNLFIALRTALSNFTNVYLRIT